MRIKVIGLEAHNSFHPQDACDDLERVIKEHPEVTEWCCRKAALEEIYETALWDDEIEEYDWATDDDIAGMLVANRAERHLTYDKDWPGGRDEGRTFELCCTIGEWND